jgi:hypothetical protein
MTNQNSTDDGVAERTRAGTASIDDAGSPDSADQATPTDEATSSQPELTPEETFAQLKVLREENRRLRAEYVRAHQTEYRRAAFMLAVLSGISGVGGLAFPDVRATLFGLAGIGFVMAILIYYLTPQRVATATVGERAYATLARVGDAISADLGVQDTYIYVPTAAANGTAPVAARLFIPLHTEYTLPDPDRLESVFVVDSNQHTRGIALPPTGALLLREFQQAMVEDLATSPSALGDQLTEAVVEGFELAEAAVVDVDRDDGRATVGVRGSTFGAPDRFDHPLPSFVATGLAVGFQTPVELASMTTDANEFEHLITYTWNAEAIDDSEDLEMADSGSLE